MFIPVIQIATCLTAAMAAWYWYKSALVNTPNSIEIIVPPTYGMTMGISSDLDQLAKALKLQSKLSARAAVWAGSSAGLSAIGVVLTLHS